MYEWTVRESVLVTCLQEDASRALIQDVYRTKAVVVRLPPWDSIGTTYFNEEKWHAGFGQSQLRDMLQIARNVGGDVIFQEQDQIMSSMLGVKFVLAPNQQQGGLKTP